MQRCRHNGRASWVLCVALGLCAASASRAQQAAPKSTGPLDARSVLVSWTNDPTKAAAESSTNAAPAGSERSPLDKRIEQAAAFAQMGSTERALSEYKAILVDDPTNKKARFGMGTVYIQMDRYADALAILEPMTKEFPDDYTLKNNIAWLYATAKDHTVRDGRKAVQVAQDALLLAPGDYHVWSTLSEAYYVSGQYDKALRAADEALRLCVELATGESPAEYRRQADKCRKAVQAMSVVE